MIEYKSIKKEGFIFLDELKKLGEDGWILCDKRECLITTTSKGNIYGYEYVFYRNINK